MSSRQSSGYSVDFISIRPAPSKEEKEYAELAIEMKINSNYSDFVNYLHRLESLSYFLKVSDISMEEVKDDMSGAIEAKLTLATLLGDAEPPKEKEKKEEKEAKFASPLDIGHSPFVSNLKPVKQAREDKKKEEFRLSGIIATGKQPVAIINDDVYQIGDKVGDREVKRIIPNEVTLTDGRGDIVLTLEKIDEVKK